MLAQADSRPVLIAACALLAANLALELGPTKPELAAPAIFCIQRAPARPAFTIKPPMIRDAEPWPRGMVIVPAETGDRMAILVPSVALDVPGDDVLSGLLAPLLDLVLPARPKLL